MPFCYCLNGRLQQANLSENNIWKRWLSRQASVFHQSDREMSLHLAGWMGDIAVQNFMASGANLTAKDSYGYTALHFAVWNMHLPVIFMLRVEAANWKSVKAQGL